MINDDPDLKLQYRMPRVFGPLPGPRNVPKDKQHLPNNQRNLVLSVTALTDAALLGELLPPNCTLDGEPLITINLNFMSNIGWLAGHDYAMLSVNMRIAHESPGKGLLRGNFIPVLWENLADPILTGREELGWAKLYADLPPPVIIGNRYSGKALWLGFKFMDIEVDELAEASAPLSAPAGHFHYKYIPRTGTLTDADVEYLEYAAPGANVAGYAPLAVTQRLAGTGSFKFHPARWEDMPFQYPIINALARLPVLEIRAAGLMHMAASGVIGDPDGGALRELD